MTNTQFNQLMTAVLELTSHFKEMREAVTAIEKRLTNVEERLTAVEDRLTNVEDRLTNVEDRLHVVESDNVEIKTNTKKTWNALDYVQNKLQEHDQDIYLIKKNYFNFVNKLRASTHRYYPL